MFCTKCGVCLPDRAKFCIQCGAQVCLPYRQPIYPTPQVQEHEPADNSSITEPDESLEIF